MEVTPQQLAFLIEGFLLIGWLFYLNHCRQDFVKSGGFDGPPNPNGVIFVVGSIFTFIFACILLGHWLYALHNGSWSI